MNKSMHVITMYILSHLGFMFFVYPDNVISSTEEGHWVPILVGCIVHLLVIWTYMKGLSYFPGKNIIEIYSKAGRIASLLFLGPAALYIVGMIIVMIRAFSEIMTIVFLSNTPLWAIMAVKIGIMIYIASKGGEAIFRIGILIALLFLPVVMIMFFSSFQNVDWRYLFPLLTKDFSFLTRRSFYESFFAFGGGFLFLGFAQPHFSYSSKRVLISVLCVIPFFFLAAYVPLLTFGHATANTLHYPYIVTMDSVHVNWLMFDRLTMFFLLSLDAFLMLFLGLMLWMAICISKRYLPLFKSYHLGAISIIIFCVCLMIPEWEVVEKLFWWIAVLRIYVFLTVPISILLLGLRSKGKGIRKSA
ncbi:GerAB/ArcD/ProY family transporter [Cohnella lupini]|uniref:Spore germination protein n=1 Tax=Cohnella lupini TaxID=1294267 RepID=A0A3D9I6D4_9BACL|nr:GerAB/ArcD/ProY family transporter [Cohnella lupini]RED57241.1 spore germination protein [Cohnella lupini]